MHVNTEEGNASQDQLTEDWVVLKDATVDSTSDSCDSHSFTDLVDVSTLKRNLHQYSGSFVGGSTDEQLTESVNMYKSGERKPLKTLLRTSLWSADHVMRKSLWTSLCQHLHRASGNLYQEMDKELFGKNVTTEDIPLPGFVDQINLTPYHLTHEGVCLVSKIVAIINHTNPDVSYSPTTYSMTSLFLHYMDPSDAYNCLYALLTAKDTRFIMQTSIAIEASRLVLRDLTKKYAKSAFVNIVRHSSNTETVFENWLWWIFRDIPFAFLVKIVDCFLVEGVKILYRAALTILILYNKYSGKRSYNTGEPVSVNICNNIARFCEKMPVDIRKFLKVAFGIRGLSRKEIKRLEVKHEMYINSRNMLQIANNDRMMRVASTHSIGVPLSRSFSGPIIMQNVKGSNILTADMLHSIWSWLPARLAVCQPELLYTSDEHGTSLRTLYSKIDMRQTTLFFIKNTKNEVFGAFCSSPWTERLNKTKNLSYFGTGETFIFTLFPVKLKYEWVGLHDPDIPNTANMFLAGDTSILTIGGGNGAAIQLDENLVHCRTETCDTYNNEPLCDEQDFTCKVVEVFGFK